MDNHNPNGRPQIVELKNTGNFAPSQWEGETLSGEMVYIRFRFNELTLKIADTDDMMDLVENPRFLVKKKLDKEKGYSQMKESEMKKHLGKHVHFKD